MLRRQQRCQSSGRCVAVGFSPDSFRTASSHPLLDPVANFWPSVHAWAASRTVAEHRYTQFPHPASQTPAELASPEDVLRTNLTGDGSLRIGYQEITQHDQSPRRSGAFAPAVALARIGDRTRFSGCNWDETRRQGWQFRSPGNPETRYRTFNKPSTSA